MSRQLLYAILMWVICLYALWRGGRAERIAAFGILANVLLTVALIAPVARRYQHVEVGVFLVDIALFALLLGVALFSTKYWPLWMAGMEGVSIIAHLTPLVPGVIPMTYFNAVQLWAWPMLGLLGHATWGHRRRSIGRVGPAGW